MDAFDAYKIYVSLKNHFTVESYDYFKYGKKSKTNFDAFLKRRDKLFFAKLGNRKGDHLEEFLVSNFIHDPKIWIGELLSDTSETRYKNWKKKHESLTYNFTNEIDFFSILSSEEFENLFSVNVGEHPKIILKYLQGEISIETVIILDSILNFIHRYDRMITDPVYKEVSNLCKKYRPFLRFEQAKMKLVVKSKLNLG
jgi:hypothetical protein